MKFIVNSFFLLLLAVAFILNACNTTSQDNTNTENRISNPDSSGMINAIIITDTVVNDTDDPAIWVNPNDPSQSLIIGTDKDENGALFVFGLDGKIIPEKTVTGLKRPNNVDLEYGLSLGGKLVDIAVATERMTHKLRIFSVPDMQPIDGGGIEVFEGETQPDFRDLMGIGLYKDKAGKIFAIVGRKTGPTDGSYLWQYELKDNGKGQVAASLVRKFGTFSGTKEIEAIWVDDVMGYVYYCDEGVGIRKYYADAAMGNEELALFGTEGFADDHEGISMYATSDSTGFIMVSDQQAQAFRIFPREGSANGKHDHPFLKSVKVSALESDGSETVAIRLNDNFPNGIFVAMSTDKTFHYFRPEDVLGDLLKK